MELVKGFFKLGKVELIRFDSFILTGERDLVCDRSYIYILGIPPNLPYEGIREIVYTTTRFLKKEMKRSERNRTKYRHRFDGEEISLDRNNNVIRIKAEMEYDKLGQPTYIK